MRTHQCIRYTVMLASFTLFVWLPALSTQAADKPSGATTPSASAEGLREVAAGAVEDTLKACLARIPKDGTAGQRMIAEQACEQEDAVRQLNQAAPRF